MDQAWLKRLVDRNPGSCMLTDYVRMTRLLSGLSESGWMKLARKADDLKQNQELQSSVLHNPDVVSFLDLLKKLDDDEKIIVLDVVRQGLFPDQPGVPLFKAASTDPKEHPKVAVKEAREEIKTLERHLRPVAVTSRLVLSAPLSFSFHCEKWQFPVMWLWAPRWRMVSSFCVRYHLIYFFGCPG